MRVRVYIEFCCVLVLKDMAEFDVFEGDALTVLREFPDSVFDTTVTSPPYWKKRDYNHPEQLGQEETPEAFVQNLAAVFDEVKRAVKETGSLWVNIDDTVYQREILGIPWMLAFELKRRGWHLRADAIWYKTNSTPEPAKIRLSRTHEYLFHFVKVPKGYYFNMDAVREPHTSAWARDCLAKFAVNPVSKPEINLFNKEKRHRSGKTGVSRAEMGSLMNPLGRNRRDVFVTAPLYALKPDLAPEQERRVFAGSCRGLMIMAEQEIPVDAKDLFEPLRLDLTSVIATNTNKFRGDHYAPYPKSLVAPCILATCPPGGTVLDPFCGSGTTGEAALEHGRNFIGIELVSSSVEIARKKLHAI